MLRIRSAAWLAAYIASTANVSASPLKTLYDFTQSSGGGSTGEFIVNSNGTMYGTTSNGGDAGFGTVFKFDPSTKAIAVLYNFMGGSDGAGPAAKMVTGNDDTVFGVTNAGGATNTGTVFKLSLKTGVEQILHSFGSGTRWG